MRGLEGEDNQSVICGCMEMSQWSNLFSRIYIGSLQYTILRKYNRLMRRTYIGYHILESVTFVPYHVPAHSISTNIFTH